MHIERVNITVAESVLDQLIELLRQTVDEGASVGWLPPMPKSTAEQYWRGRLDALQMGKCVLLVAWEDEIVVGTAQLALEDRTNGTHRAEVQKVMVHQDYRRRGIGYQLMEAIEDHAKQEKRTLLFLDTLQGEPSEKLYAQVGYIQCGVIPQYARIPDGSLQPTVFYHKILD